MKGVDFAGAKLTRSLAQALVDEGVDFFGRYLWGVWKELTDEEIAIAKEFGLYIMSIAQGGKGDLLGGYAAGVRLGAKAFLAAQSKGQPFGSAIFFAVDFDVTKQSELDVIGETLRGVRASLNKNYKVGVYGEAQVVDFTAKNGFSDVEFQTYAWSGGKLSEYADIYQYQNDVKFVGIQVDHDKSFGGEGFWCGPAKIEPEGVSDADMEAIKNLEAKVDRLESLLSDAVDPQEIPAWAKDVVAKAIRHGVIQSTDKLPKLKVEVCQMWYNVHSRENPSCSLCRG